mmetsp:Transcript_27615/g.72575  ORF Transcript_27615/g.72575 Transcript_27615/m.72575 type:complete len:398 (-) Transcript_27615:202-1395(-)
MPFKTSICIPSVIIRVCAAGPGLTRDMKTPVLGSSALGPTSERPYPSCGSRRNRTWWVSAAIAPVWDSSLCRSCISGRPNGLSPSEPSPRALGANGLYSPGNGEPTDDIGEVRTWSSDGAGSSSRSTAPAPRKMAPASALVLRETSWPFIRMTLMPSVINPVSSAGPSLTREIKIPVRGSSSLGPSNDNPYPRCGSRRITTRTRPSSVGKGSRSADCMFPDCSAPTCRTPPFLELELIAPGRCIFFGGGTHPSVGSNTMSTLSVPRKYCPASALQACVISSPLIATMRMPSWITPDSAAGPDLTFLMKIPVRGSSSAGPCSANPYPSCRSRYRTARTGAPEYTLKSGLSWLLASLSLASRGAAISSAVTGVVSVPTSSQWDPASGCARRRSTLPLLP